jgi:hypothetical protein
VNRSPNGPLIEHVRKDRSFSSSFDDLYYSMVGDCEAFSHFCFELIGRTYRRCQANGKRRVDDMLYLRRTAGIETSLPHGASDELPFTPSIVMSVGARIFRRVTTHTSAMADERARVHTCFVDIDPADYQSQRIRFSCWSAIRHCITLAVCENRSKICEQR